MGQRERLVGVMLCGQSGGREESIRHDYHEGESHDSTERQLSAVELCSLIR